MTTMNISLPVALRDEIDEQVARRRFGSTSEYVRDLIRRDLDRAHLRELLLAGIESPAVEVDGSFFDELRGRVRSAADG